MSASQAKDAGVGVEVPLVPARMVNEVLYCERLMHLEWVQGEWADNHFTIDGKFVHRRADKPRALSAKRSKPTPEAAPEEPYQARAVWLSSPALGVTAKIDIVAIDGDRVVPIEYKRGRQPLVPERAYLPERAQLCCQVLLLREQGYTCEHGEIYFAEEKRRVVIDITPELIATTLAAIARARELYLQTQAPPPLYNSPKCRGCSLVGICLPDETNHLGGAAPSPARAKSLPLAPPTQGLPGALPSAEQSTQRSPTPQIAHDAEIFGDATTLDATDNVSTADPTEAEGSSRGSGPRGNARTSGVTDPTEAKGSSPPEASSGVRVIDPMQAQGSSQLELAEPHESRRHVAPQGQLELAEPAATPEPLQASHDAPLTAQDIAAGAALRRLHPARDDKAPLLVQEHGARVGIDGELLKITSREGDVSTARLPNTSHVALYGNAQISTQAVVELLRRGIPVCYFSTGGYYLGRTLAHDSNQVTLRVAQYDALQNEARCLELASRLIASKIANSRTLVRRNATGDTAVLLRELKILSRKAARAASQDELLGIEGTAARCYFSALPQIVRPPDGSTPAFDWSGRNRRPPTDPINAMLSLCYTMLTKDFSLALQVAGLDAMFGFYHQLRFGRPSLALDLMEEFRPIIADSIVIKAINTGEITQADFIHQAGSCTLTSSGRRRLLGAYERRLGEEVTHPTFGYRISYRRVLEVQARLFARVITGELPSYPAFRTR